MLIITKKSRRYVIDSRTIKEKLGLEGDLISMTLYSGLPPTGELPDLDKDDECFEFMTVTEENEEKEINNENKNKQE